jgi:hypothetical protein
MTNTETLARKAGYVLGMIIVPKKCYTLTDLTTRIKYRMNMNETDLVQILKREVVRKQKVSNRK